MLADLDELVLKCRDERAKAYCGILCSFSDFGTKA
jgi:hypothetical protein